MLPDNANATTNVADLKLDSLLFVRDRNDSIKTWALIQAAAQPAL